MDITKEQLIGAFKNNCEKSKMNPEKFSVAGSIEEPFISIKASDNISIAISRTFKHSSIKNFDNKIYLIFGEVVQYKDFELGLEEYNELVETFNKFHDAAENHVKEEIIERCLAEIEGVL